MPYTWLRQDADPATTTLMLWTHQSLPKGGFVAFIAVTAALMALPLLESLGSPTHWVLLAFVLAAVSAMWWALRRNTRDRQVAEELTLTAGRITLIRRGPHGAVKSWGANPHWVRITLYPNAGPVEDYLTLTGNGREVEIGAFLTPEERSALASELRTALAAHR